MAGQGGIGSIAIQLAKHLGAYVATTVSTNDKQFVQELGANQAIDAIQRISKIFCMTMMQF